MNFTTGAESPSNYNIRTKQYIDYSLIEQVSIDDSIYTYRCIFYNEDKSFFAIGSYDSVSPPKNGARYVRIFIKRIDGGTITPTDEYNFVLNTKIESVDKKIASIKTEIENSACIFTLEQGSISQTTGIDVASTTTIRTRGFIPYETVYKICANDGYELKIYYYNDMKQKVIFNNAANFYYLTSGFGEYKLDLPSTPDKDVKYIRICIQNESKSAIDTTANVGLKIYGLSAYREDLYNEQNNRDIIEQLKPQMPIATACLGPTTEFHKTNFGIVCIADLHGNYKSLDDAYNLQQYLKKYYTTISLPY